VLLGQSLARLEPAEFFAKRKGKAVGKDLMKFLRDAPKRPPDQGDELR
jgi:hypothetical protein